MEDNMKHFRTMYLIGAISTIAVLCGIVLDMMIGSITGGDLTSLPQTAVERFNQLNQNWILGLYNLDFLNLINQIILIPSVFSIYLVHKYDDNGYALLTLILFLIGTTIFITNNTALTMFELSKKYFTAVSAEQRNLIASAGEAMLAKGAHGSLSVFIGFALPTFANILLSHVMIKRRIFSKTTSIFGLVGNILMLLYIILVTFSPSVEKIAILIAMPGGLLVMSWMIMYMLKLLKLSFSEVTSYTT